MEEPQGLGFPETAKWQFAHVTNGVLDQVQVDSWMVARQGSPALTYYV